MSSLFLTMQTDTANGGAEAAMYGTNDDSQGQSASSSQVDPQPQKKGKEKKIWSCRSCRRRKLKCDRSDPCGACQARGEGHSCTWEEGQRPEKKNRDSLEKLPSLIEKLTDEVKELKMSSEMLMESMRYKGGAPFLEGLSVTSSMAPDISPLLGFSTPYRSPDRSQWTQAGGADLLPQSPLSCGLISHFLHTSASLVGFVDASRLVSEVEEAEQIRGNGGEPVTPDLLDVKVSLILACASLAAVNLDAVKAQELGVAHINIDVFARDLWRKSRSLIKHLDLDAFTSPSFEGSTSALPTLQSSLVCSHTCYQRAGPASSCAPTLPLRVVAIKILLLLAARSFAAPSEYLKLHLDAISTAVEASLDSPLEDDMPLEERELRWQLWSSLCVLDWTSPGIYHNGSYYIRAEMHSDPPSRVPGVPDDRSHAFTAETEHLERLNQTRYFFEHALALASLSRKAEDCIIRPGPISPAQAAELCSELDALDNKLTFYQLLGAGARRGGEGSDPNNKSVSSSAGGERGRINGSGNSPASNKHRLPPLHETLQMQHTHLTLELALIRFKLFRHEAFRLMHDATTSGPLRTMCMDACMDACTAVLSQCRNRGIHDVPHGRNPGTTQPDPPHLATHPPPPPPSSFPGPSFRPVIHPASSAALVAQVLLHATQSANGLGLLIPGNRNAAHPSGRPVSRAGIGSSTDRRNPTIDLYPYAEGERRENPAGRYNLPGGALWTGGFERGKVGVLQGLVDGVVAELESLEATSPLARYKLAMHRQCM